MPTEVVRPDAILALLNLSGTVSTLQDSPDGDTTWLTASSGSSNTSVTVSFASPSAPLDNADGTTHKFRVSVRKNAAAGNNPTFYMELRNNGALVASSSTFTLSTDSAVVEQLWEPYYFSADGSGIEAYIYATAATGGNAKNVRTVEVGSIEWVPTTAVAGEQKTDTDSATLTVVAGASTEAASSTTDSAALTSIETASVSVEVTASDATALTVVETESAEVPTTPITTDDTATILSDEVAWIEVNCSGADPPTVTAVETAAMSATATAADSATVTVVEGATVDVATNAADTGAVSSVEGGTVVPEISAADTAVLSSNEFYEQSAEIGTSDSATLSVIEDGVALPESTPIASDDSAVITSVETASVIISITSSDDVALSVTELTEQTVALTTTDDVYISSEESEDIYQELDISAADDAIVAVIESAVAHEIKPRAISASRDTDFSLSQLADGIVCAVVEDGSFAEASADPLLCECVAWDAAVLVSAIPPEVVGIALVDGITVVLLDEKEG